jgi:hypothetical protein
MAVTPARGTRIGSFDAALPTILGRVRERIDSLR